MSLHLQNINIQIGGVDHLKDFTYEFKRGRLYTILGRTLAGKTTLLRTIAGLLEPQSGSVQFCGKDLKDVPVWQRNVAMVYQQFINYPHLNVIENVVFPLLRNGVSAKDAKKRAAEVLAMVGLYEYKNRRPSELSGGQQQRVALARALAKQSEIILLDEPLANLDYKLREQLREEFHNIFEKQGDAIVIYTTTEPAEAIQLGHELIVMDKGAITQRGKPLSVYRSPASTACAEIINDPPMNLYRGSIQSGQIVFNGQIKLSLPEHLKKLAEGSYRFGLRAADIFIDGEINHTIKLCEIAGSQTILHLEGAIGESVLYMDGVHNYPAGETVKVSLATELLYVFDQDGHLVCAPEIMEK